MLASSADAPATPEEDLVAWKSHVGVRMSADRRMLRSTAKGWGSAGAVSDGLITRTSDVEGFLAVIPQPNTTLFIGLTNMQGSLYDTSRAHQEDLEFALRLAADGTLSYQSRERAATAYHALQIEQDILGTVEKGDAIGMRVSPDRRGLTIVTLDAASVAKGEAEAAASSGGTAPRRHFTVLKHFNEVMSFPLKVMAVFGASKTELGPVCWLRGKPQKARAGGRVGPRADVCTSLRLTAPHWATKPNALNRLQPAAGGGEHEGPRRSRGGGGGGVRPSRQGPLSGRLAGRRHVE